MLNVVTLLTLSDDPAGKTHGVRDFWKEWGPTYLARLFRGLEQHIKEDFVPYALTNVPHLVQQHAIPLNLRKPIPHGWWSKLGMFDESFGLSGRTLYLDLDNVVGADLSAMLFLEPDPMLALDDKVYPRMFNGSTLYCLPERLRFLWDVFAENPEKVMYDYSIWPKAADQAFIADHMALRGLEVPFMQDLLPEGYILNSRVELETGAPWEKTALVYGSWDPKPHMSTHPFYARNWK